MMYAIAGVSGNTGKVVAEQLLRQGKSVRVIVRDAARGETWKEKGAEVAVADLTDAAALTTALRGAEGAYLLVPPNFAAADLRAFQDQVSRSFATAVAASGIPHVVLLSSIGAQHEAGTGPIAGLHLTERLLGAIPNVLLSSLRAGYFLENLGSSLGSVKAGGALPSFFPASLAFPMVSTTDIGTLAAELLLDPPPASRIVELGTERSHVDIVAALGARLGREVAVQEAPLEAVVPTLVGFGFSPSMAGLYAEMTSAVVSGLVAFEGHGRVESREPLATTVGGLLAT